MKQRIIIDPNLTLDELKKKIDSGSRFIIFQYCISVFFAVTLKRFSPVIFINPDERLSKYYKRYNILSLIFGWWGLPWGPVYTIKYVNFNKKGGIDYTEEIMLNITEESIKHNEVELKVTNELFCKPGKWDTIAFKKALKREFERDYNVKKLIVGLFINTEDGVSPFYTIGLKVEKNYENYVEPLKTALFKQFSKHTTFEFININEDEKISRLLEKQGEVIINKLNVL